MRYSKILILILFFGLLLRIINISGNSLYGDELTIVYDAYSILKTGQDQLGNSLPLTFEMGAGRPAGYVYFSIPFVVLFGPNEIGARTLSILSGLGIIILLYLFGKKLFSEKVGLGAAFITSVSPWDIALSRGGFEAHFALFTALLASYLILLAKQKGIFYIISALGFGLTIHTYPTYKLVLPLFLIIISLYERSYEDFLNIKNRFYLIIASIILGFLISLSLIQTLTAGSESRFFDINVFSQSNLREVIVQKINFERSISSLSQSFSQYFHNKPVEYSKVLIDNFLQNFSLDFLILHGDGHPRHNMATMGEIYLAELMLLLFGIVVLWQKARKTAYFLMGWILVAALGSTPLGPPHALRSAFMLPALIIFSAYGLSYLISLPKNKFITTVTFLLVGIFTIQFIFFAYKLYFLAPKAYGNFWAYPAKLATDIAKKEEDKFDYVILSDQIDNLEFAYPVYAKIEPNLVILQNKQKAKLGEYQFKKFDNVYIGYLPDSEIENFILNLTGSVLYIGQLQKRDILIDHDVIFGQDNMPALLVIRKI